MGEEREVGEADLRALGGNAGASWGLVWASWGPRWASWGLVVCGHGWYDGIGGMRVLVPLEAVPLRAVFGVVRFPTGPLGDFLGSAVLGHSRRPRSVYRRKIFFSVVLVAQVRAQHTVFRFAPSADWSVNLCCKHHECG